MTHERVARVRELAAVIEAARLRAPCRIFAQQGDDDPDAYREEHGRCPDNYNWDEEEQTCVPTGGDDDEAVDEKPAAEEPTEPEPTEPEPKKPTKKLEVKTTKPETEQQRKKREAKLWDLFRSDPEQYRQEVARMRDDGRLPDRETAELLVKVDDVDSLPPKIRRSPKRLRQVIEQQEAQRQHEKRVLDETTRYLENFEAERERAIESGKKPAKLNVLKLLSDLDQQYGRRVADNKSAELLQQHGDKLAKGFGSAKPKPGSLSYRLRTFFERLVRPLPRWKPFAKAAVMAQVDVSDAPRLWHMGFPPYDALREPRRYIADQPSGRPAFPPYGPHESWHDDARDAQMRGFPPYDKATEPFDSKTVGFPPYNKKPAHMSRGFPPFHDGKNVYRHRQEAVERAVN